MKKKNSKAKQQQKIARKQLKQLIKERTKKPHIQ